MCLKRVNWQQYTLSILLLMIVLVSNSSQHKIISKPQPFSKSVGDDKDGFIPIISPTNYKPISTTSIPEPVIQKNEHTITDTKPTAIAQIQKQIDTNEDDLNDKNEDEVEKLQEQEEIRSIKLSLQELNEMVIDFLAIVGQSNDGTIQKRSINDQRAYITDLLFNENVINGVKKFTEKYIFQAASGSALQNLVPAGGRLFLFKGMINSMR